MKRWALSLDLKEAGIGAGATSGGNLLYFEGGKCEKAQVLYDDLLCLGTLSSGLEDDHNVFTYFNVHRDPEFCNDDWAKKQWHSLYL